MNLFSKIKEDIHKRLIKPYKSRSFHRKFIKPGDLVFDIGAHRGERTEIYLKLGAKVVLAEPQPSCLKILNNKFSENPSVTIIPMALAECEGDAEMFISNVTEVSTLSREFIEKYSYQKWINWSKKERVSLTTLDRMISHFGKPQYIKIDVEGYEINVLNGLSQSINLISFEYNQPLKERAIDCAELLNSKFNCAFNFMKYEEMTLERNDWMTFKDLKIYISTQHNSILTGEIFSRELS